MSKDAQIIFVHKSALLLIVNSSILRKTNIIKLDSINKKLRNIETQTSVSRKLSPTYIK